MFGFFKRRETLATRNRLKDNWAQVAQSHGWLLDRIDDDDPWFKKYWLDKELTIKSWADLFEGGKPAWPNVTMGMCIGNGEVRITHQSIMMGRGETKTYQELTGMDLKWHDEQIIETCEKLAVNYCLEIMQKDYSAYLDRGGLPSVVCESRIQMLDFLKAK